MSARAGRRRGPRWPIPSTPSRERPSSRWPRRPSPARSSSRARTWSTSLPRSARSPRCRRRSASSLRERSYRCSSRRTGSRSRPSSTGRAVPDLELEVGRRHVRLTSPDKLLFPGDGVTKRDLADYYAAIGDTIVPHLRNRPFTLKRYPYGIRGQPYFAKQAPKGKPSWVPTRQFRTWPREGGSRLVDFALVNEPAAAVWMVQMNCIDMNAWYSRVDKPERPDYVVFDLDPPESRNGFAQAIKVAHLIREALDRLELRSYVKTSGADGIHVLVPITRRSTYKDTYDFAELVSRRVEDENPGLATTEWLKKKRRGVLVDHRQNGHGKTIASAYSVRPKPGAPVSTPLRWEELGEKVRPRDFGMREALARVDKHGDLFEPVLRGGQALGPALRALRAGT